MSKISMIAALTAGLFMFIGCGKETKIETNVVEIRAVGMTFEGPSELPAGWTTFRFINESGMIH